jgi:NhaP-type Na+/H+ or K+/H+ antiporter
MATRVAAALALIAFALCLVIGIGASNSFATTLQRALVAMGGTLVVGLVLGAIAQAMVDENVKSETERLKNESPDPPDGR